MFYLSTFPNFCIYPSSMCVHAIDRSKERWNAVKLACLYNLDNRKKQKQEAALWITRTIDLNFVTKTGHNHSLGLTNTRSVPIKGHTFPQPLLVWHLWHHLWPELLHWAPRGGGSADGRQVSLESWPCPGRRHRSGHRHHRPHPHRVFGRGNSLQTNLEKYKLTIEDWILNWWIDFFYVIFSADNM